MGHFFPLPLTFSANRKKPIFGKIKNDKSVFLDISWPLTSFIFFFCAGYWNRLIALMKLFSLGSTVLAGLTKLWSPAAIERYRMTIIVLRTSVMVWFTWRSTSTVFSRTASRCAAHTQRIEGWINFIQHSLFSTNGTDSFQNHRDPYSLDEPNDIPSKSIRPVFLLESPANGSNYCLHSTLQDTIRLVQLPDHPPLFL